MRKPAKTIYQTPAELDQRIRDLEAQSRRLVLDAKQQHFIHDEIVRLRIHADAERLFEAPRRR